MSNHAVFQILATTPAGMEAGTGWFSADANKYAKERYPDLARDAAYAFTNAHVVLGASTLFSRHGVCRRHDLPLQVVGIARDADLAVVKLSGEAKSFLESKLREKTGIRAIPSLSMIDSDLTMPAKYDAASPDAAVVAIGYPLGSEFQSVTTGVIEGLKRIPDHSESLFLAGTYTIQPGNSGGPLLYKNGVVGINSMKATGASTDNLNMSIASNTVKSYLPHLLDESQLALTKKVVQLANHLNAQGVEVALLEAMMKEDAVIGNPANMKMAYASAMNSEKICCGATIPDAHKTLRSVIMRYANEPGFHKLFSTVTNHIHTGNLVALRNLASAKNMSSLLCEHCVTTSARCNDCGGKKRTRKTQCVNTACGTSNLYETCRSAAPAKVIHSPTLGFEYRPASSLTAKALNAPTSGGVVVSSVLKYGPTKDLQKYDVISAVKTASDGLMQLDENGEHYNASWGLSLGLSDLVERAPLGTEVAFQLHRGGESMVLKYTKNPLSDADRPAVRALDASEAHLNAAVTVGGVTFKVLRMNDLMDPRLAASPAAQYAAPTKRHLEKVIVADVSPASAAFHHYSLMPGMVMNEINKEAVAETGSWISFCEKLADAPLHGGVALLGTECGGVDTIRVSQEEAASLHQYLSQIN